MTDNAPDKSSAETKPLETMGEGVADTSNPEIMIDAPASTPQAAADGTEGEAKQPRPTAAQTRADKLKARSVKAHAERAADSKEFTGSFADPGMASTFDEAQAWPQDKAPPEARKSEPSDTPAPAPKTHTLKVRHQEKDLTEDEILTLARKALAADDYLGDARKLYDEARQHADQARRARGAPPQEQRAQDTDLPTDPSQTPPQEDPLAKALERVQYGEDPAEVAKDVRQALRSDQAQTTQQAILNQRMTDDLSHTLRVFAKFKKENNALLAEPHAEAVMQDILHKTWHDDLRSLGVPEDRIPANPNDLQQWHRRYRVMGHTVRSAEQAFDEVVKGYKDYRAGKSGAPSTSEDRQAPPTDRRSPDVSLNREARRASIPQQPARSAAPPALPRQATQERKPYSQSIEEMRAARKRGIQLRRAV